jgi:hypothetical protein
MKSLILNCFLTLSAAVLLLLNWQVRQPAAAVKETPPPATVPAAPAAAPAKPAPPTETTNAAASLDQDHPTFEWGAIESADYKEYAGRLRAVGFPEELIQGIIIADIDKLYEPREQVLKPKPVPYDAPLAQRQNPDISPAEWERVKQLRDLEVEKQSVLEGILGVYVPREILRTPISRNYEAYEYAISVLPEAKCEAVQTAQENEIFIEGLRKTTITDHALELEAFKQSRQQRDDALHAVLTGEEFSLYEMNTTPAGTELARRVIGMEPTEQEFSTMFKIAYKNWVDTGGVYGRWRAVHVPGNQIAAADQEMNTSLQAALGPDRYLDYQMAISGTGQQMRNFGARYELPRQTMTQAFELQTQLDRLGPARSFLVNPSGDAAAQAPSARAAELNSQLQQLLGPELSQAWQNGRNIRVNLDP